MTRAVVTTLITLISAGCGGSATTSVAAAPATPTASSSTVTAVTAFEPPTTTTPPVTELPSWPPGTVTCESLHASVPSGVDSFVLDYDQGLLTYYWGENKSGTLQFLDDPTCTADSDAWRFLIGNILEPVDPGVLCDFLGRVETFEPANHDTVLTALDDAADRCR